MPLQFWSTRKSCTCNNCLKSIQHLWEAVVGMGTSVKILIIWPNALDTFLLLCLNVTWATYERKSLLGLMIPERSEIVTAWRYSSKWQVVAGNIIWVHAFNLKWESEHWLEAPALFILSAWHQWCTSFSKAAPPNTP